MSSHDLIERVRKALGDRYTVITAVGRGGNASIFGAYDQSGQKVAIKVLHPELTVSVAADRFLREIRYVAQLDHPHLARLLDTGETDYLLWLVMPYVPGDTLRQALNRERRLPIDRAARIACEVLDALDHAHAHGIAHRDIKPDNIVLSPEGAVLVDLGIARAIASSGPDRVTRSGFVVGTEEYMSPEQAGGDPDVDGRTDLYSLGAVMYELLTGSRPFRAGNLQKLLHQIVYATPPPIHSLRKDVPEELENVVAMALQKEPAKRYKSGLDFAAELTRVHQRLREENARIDRQEQFGVLRRLKFFHEFSHAEIWEVLRASSWQDYAAGEEIVKEGEMDDRFYILVTGSCAVERHSQRIGALETGDCFGEASYVPGAKRTATIRSANAVTVLKVSSTLLEQVSASCQLRFNRVFLRTLIARLQSAERATGSRTA